MFAPERPPSGGGACPVVVRQVYQPAGEGQIVAVDDEDGKEYPSLGLAAKDIHRKGLAADWIRNFAEAPGGGKPKKGRAGSAYFPVTKLGGRGMRPSLVPSPVTVRDHIQTAAKQPPGLNIVYGHQVTPVVESEDNRIWLPATPEVLKRASFSP